MKRKRKIEVVKTAGWVPDGVKVFITQTIELYQEGQIYSLPTEKATSLIRKGYAVFPKMFKDVEVVIKRETKTYKENEIRREKKRKAIELINTGIAIPTEQEGTRIPLAQQLDNFQPQADLRLRELIGIYCIGGDIWKFARECYPEYKKLCDAEVVGTEDLDFREFERETEYYKSCFNSVFELLQINPEAIRLPFIVKAIENFLKVYRSLSPGLLTDFGNLWMDILPSRQGGDISYSDKILKKFIIDGIKEGYTKQQAIKLISKKLKISEDRLCKITIGDGKLRHRKASNSQ